jgi:lipoyl(octanoyl) transferase
MKLYVSFLGRIDHHKAWLLQTRLLRLRLLDLLPDILLLLEHPPTITTGRRENPENLMLPLEKLRQMGVSVCKTDRGGDVTYHGPGQVVGYPIIHLGRHGMRVHDYVYNLEQTAVRCLNDEYDIKAVRDETHRGVWIGDKKIMAIGCAVKHRITMHGFALNVNTDLAHFCWIRPCGITGKGVTSIQELTGRVHDMQETGTHLLKHFQSQFGLTPELISPQKLEALALELEHEPTQA